MEANNILLNKSILGSYFILLKTILITSFTYKGYPKKYVLVKTTNVHQYDLSKYCQSYNTDRVIK